MKKRMSKRRIKKYIKKNRKYVEDIFKGLIADETIHPASSFNSVEESLKEDGYHVELDPATTNEDRNNRVCRVRVAVPVQEVNITWKRNGYYEKV